MPGGDCIKAKQLADLLHLRVHAGEERRNRLANKLHQHDDDVNKAIVCSVHWFVQALHNAGGSGRYTQNVRQTQQVVATAVSQAAALSASCTSVAEIGRKLGLSPDLNLICNKRYDSLTDWDWEQLFDSVSLGGISLPPE